MSTTKTCKKCGVEHPTSEFHRRTKSPDGLGTKCKSCLTSENKLRYAADPETARAKRRAAYWIDPEADKAVNKKWAEENRKSIRVRVRARRASNPEVAEANRRNALGWYRASDENASVVKERSRQWAEQNPERVKSNRAAWQEKNASKLAAYELCKRTVRGSLPPWVSPEELSRVFLQAREATGVTGVKNVVDHIYALRGRTVSGLNCPANLRVLDHKSNARKHNKLPGHLAHELWDPTGSDVFHG